MEVDCAIPSTEAPPSGDVEMGEAENDCQLDCYPYTFSPLLLFAQSSYFDKGHSNYNSVAQFFAPALPDVNMLDGVLYDRKNMLYEDLLTYVTTNRMLVPCCIDAHFTAMQVMSDMSAIYYDPLQATLSYVHGESYKKLACFLLLKCNLGDSQHLQVHSLSPRPSQLPVSFYLRVLAMSASPRHGMPLWLGRRRLAAEVKEVVAEETCPTLPRATQVSSATTSLTSTARRRKSFRTSPYGLVYKVV